MDRAGERITGAIVEDIETGARTTVRAAVVVNCTGVWTDEIQTLAGGRGRFNVRASKGVHIVVARDRINSEVGLILRTPTSVLFVIPWGTHWIIGTTDTDWNLDLAHPAASKADIDYLLAQVNSVLTHGITHADIQGVFAGLRPLLSGEDEQTSQLSREHAVARPQPGLISIAGGKYTTYRVMAADAIDAAREDIGPGVADSVTEHIPLLGAEGYRALMNQIDRLARKVDLPVWRLDHLLGRSGSLVNELLELGAGDPSLFEPVPGAEEYLKVELLYAVTHEGALHLDDLLARRTRISIETLSRGVDSARAVADLVAPVLGWDEERAATEVQLYTQRVQAERESQQMPDDHEANAERTSARDARRRDARQRDGLPSEGTPS